MKTLTYDASPHHILIVDGKEIRGGEEFKVTADRALQLIADPGIPVKESGQDFSKLKRSDLDRVAEQAGVTDPESLPSKDAVITAITEASAGSQLPPAATPGEGHEPNEEA